MATSSKLQKVVTKAKGVASYIFWATLSLLFLALIVMTLAGWLGIGPSNSSRQQGNNESDYDYHQRLKADDQEQYKDCGFKPTC